VSAIAEQQAADAIAQQHIAAAAEASRAAEAAHRQAEQLRGRS
jgi:hypothetical protein